MGVTREEAAEILEEVKLNDDSMYAYSEPYITALDMAIGTLKARETSLEKVAADYGLMPDGVAFALERYQKVLCDITHNRLSKPTYYADDIIRLVHDVQCDGCELIEPRVMTWHDVIGAALECKPVYVEVKDGEDKERGDDRWAMLTQYKDSITNGMIRAMSSYVTSEVLFADWYNKSWRCWTSRPTDEQREATPWEQ